MENSLAIPQKAKQNHHITQEFHSWYIPPKLKINFVFQTTAYTQMFIAVLFTIAKDGKQPNYLSMDKWINMVWCIYATEYYSVIKMDRVLIRATT